METIQTAKELFMTYMSAGIPTYLHGPPGVGKSDLVAQIARELKIGFLDYRLGMMETVDLLGLPSLVMRDGVPHTAWARPDMWPQAARDGERGIILFDELSDCGRAMQSVTYQIFLNHRAGTHEILPGWYLCAAGNRREDKAAAQALSTALCNRFAHIDVQPCHQAWDVWAIKNKIHHYVRGFIKMRPGLLHKMAEGQKAFPSPRSWARVSSVSYLTEDHSLLHRSTSGLIGDGTASEFMTFLKGLTLPTLEDVIAAPTKCQIPDEPSSVWALASMLSANLTKENFTAVYKYICREAYGTEFEVCTVRDAIMRDPDLTETKEYAQFSKRNAHIKV